MKKPIDKNEIKVIHLIDQLDAKISELDAKIKLCKEMIEKKKKEIKMMEDHEFCDKCPGCRPAILDPETLQGVPANDPLMIAINKMWDNETTYAQRRSFIEVTLHNSRNPVDIQRFQSVSSKIQEILKSMEYDEHTDQDD